MNVLMALYKDSVADSQSRREVHSAIKTSLVTFKPLSILI